MVGDATPNGWSIDTPTPLQASETDPLLFTWEGSLNTGEMKLCLTTGSWDAPFIRPMENGAEISSADINDVVFQMHAGDPDEKWRVTEAGTYSLSFNLRDWTMSTRYVGEPEAPDIEPIETDALYIVGDATPNGWNIDAPTALTKTADYTFEYDGPLTAGEFKACLSAGSWDVSFIRPASEGVIINKDGVQTPEFIFSANPDNKWKIADAGSYHIVFDLRNWTISATFNGELEPDLNPIESNTLYMIGDATPGGWSMDDATAFTQSTDNHYIFTWEGQLVTGSMKACLEPDGTFSCPFLRPSSPAVSISSAGVAAPDFVYTTGPDDQWAITEAGRYRITFDLENRTIKAEFLTDGGGDTPGKTPIESNTLYMIGDATPGGWSMDNASAFTRSDSNKYEFSWEGELKTGSMKACLEPDGTFSCPFLRPSSAGVSI
ncbi:MAG: SusF/SusE family outer membrane protein, partial [Muribaculaceae bacterium]|nr:SusF/SusE family outer membrane protein [Muribaculaceae bacterium]